MHDIMFGENKNIHIKNIPNAHYLNTKEKGNILIYQVDMIQKQKDMDSTTTLWYYHKYIS
jgi:hypothetical protein